MQIKLGRFTLSDRQKEKPDLIEQGATGTVLFGGMLQDTGEYLADFKWPQSVKLVEKMRRSDGQVKAGLMALTLPLLSAHWDVTPASDSSLDREVALAVKDNLFDGMDITWDEFLRHVLLMLPFGFMVFEKVWELRDGLWAWRKLAPRLPPTIQRWHTGKDTGDLESVEQWAWKSETYQTIKIPAEKLLLFTHEKEGSNFAGVSILRAAYKHWFYKNTLYAIDGIAAERHGVGLASFTFPNNATAEQKAKIERIGERLNAHERGYVALPEDIKLALLGVAGQLHDIKGSIEHHDAQILRSVLAQFISLGSKGVGSYALSSDQSGFFLMALRATGKNICDTINNSAVKQLVDYNWQVKKYPKLTVSELDYIDVPATVDAIVKAVNGGALTAGDDIEAEVRRIMHLPPKAPRPPGEEPQAEEPPIKEPPAAELPAESNGARPKKVMAAAEPIALTPGRDLSAAEKLVAFDAIEGGLDRAEERLLAAIAEVRQKQVRRLADLAMSDIASKNIKRLGDIDVPYRQDMAKAIELMLRETYAFGKAQVRSEAAKQGVPMKAQDPLGRVDYLELLWTRALSLSNVFAGKLKAALVWEALNQLRTGKADRQEMEDALTSVSDREIRMTAGMSDMEAFGAGRKAAAEELGGVTEVLSSAILDKETCDYCREMDGKSWTPGSEPAREPPYVDCGEGYGKCRCVWVYTFAAEVVAKDVAGMRAYAPDQPRDEQGQWTNDGGGVLQTKNTSASASMSIDYHGKVTPAAKRRVEESIDRLPVKSAAMIEGVEVFEGGGGVSTYGASGKEYTVGARVDMDGRLVNLYGAKDFGTYQGNFKVNTAVGHEAGHIAQDAVWHTANWTAFKEASIKEGMVSSYARKHYAASQGKGINENFAEFHGIFHEANFKDSRRGMFEAAKTKNPETFKVFAKIWVDQLGGQLPK